MKLKPACIASFSILVCVLVRVPFGWAQPSAPAGDTLAIGVIAPQTGFAADKGKSIARATEAFFNRVNSQGGINGRKIKVSIYDDGYEPMRTVEGAKKLVRDEKVFAILSIFGAPTTQAAMPILKDSGVAVIGPVSTANMAKPLLKNVFAVRPDAEKEAEVLVERLAEDRGIKEIGVFYQDDSFGMSGLNAVNTALQKHGLKLAGSGSYKRNTSDVDAAVESITAKKPKAVFVYAVTPASSEFVKKCIARGFNPIFVGPTSIPTLAFMKDTMTLPLTFFAALTVPVATDTSLTIVQQYEADLKAAGAAQPDQFGLEAYIVAKITAEGLKRAGSNPTKESLFTALETMHDVDLGGVNVSYSAQDHQGLKQLFLAKIEGGKLVKVKSLK